ncbi:MAG: glycosyltransferase [Candidatus Aenigmatarchaeota archaeon]
MLSEVTILIPTIGRPRLLKQVLKGLTRQSFTDFRILLIMKLGDVESIKVAEYFNRFLDIKIIFQKISGLIGAYIEGIRNINSDVIIFLDDDAVPDPDCVKEHVLTYEHPKIFGVSGDVIPAQICNDVLKPIEGSSEIANYYKEHNIIKYLGEKLWNSPLNGQENYLAYITKAGYSNKNIYLNRNRIVNSLLCMAANMSVLSQVIKDFQMPSFLKQGINFEQILGWRLWKNNYNLVFNPRAKVYHILHEGAISRSINQKSVLQATIEDELLFYYLLVEGEDLSKMHRIVSFSYRYLLHIKKLNNNWKREISILKGMILGNIYGFKWLLSNKIKEAYKPIKNGHCK